MKLNPTYFPKTEILTFLFITILGVANGQVTVFYIIYLFWFQELVKTVINLAYALFKGKRNGKKLVFHEVFGNFFILFIYVVFIIVLFGFMLNWDNKNLMGTNMRTLFFRNIYFNINILLFTIEYLLYRLRKGKAELDLEIFNRSHIILYISVIIGAFIQLVIASRYTEYFSASNLWVSAAVVAPFLILKILLTKNQEN